MPHGPRGPSPTSQAHHGGTAQGRRAVPRRHHAEARQKPLTALAQLFSRRLRSAPRRCSGCVSALACREHLLQTGIELLESTEHFVLPGLELFQQRPRGKSRLRLRRGMPHRLGCRAWISWHLVLAAGRGGHAVPDRFAHRLLPHGPLIRPDKRHLGKPGKPPRIQR